MRESVAISVCICVCQNVYIFVKRDDYENISFRQWDTEIDKEILIFSLVNILLGRDLKGAELLSGGGETDQVKHSVFFKSNTKQICLIL